MDLALFDFIVQIGNARITGEVNLTSVDTVFDGRAVSRYGKSLIFFFHAKGHNFVVIVNGLTLCRRIFIRCRRFEYPRGHLRLDSLTIVDLVIDLRVQLGFVHAELQAVIVYGSRDVFITRDFDGVFCFDNFRASSSICQRPAFFEGRNVIRVGRDFASQHFQLGHIHRVGIGGAGRNACDLSRSAGCFVTYRKSGHLSLPCADESAYFFLRFSIGLQFTIRVHFKLIVLFL